MNRVLYVLLAGILVFAGSNASFAQQQVAKFTPEKTVEKGDKEDDKKAADEAKSKSAAQTQSSSCESCRWFEPTAATFSMRYRTLTDASDVRTFEQGQQRIILGGKFKFDKDGKYTVNVHASSGYYFNWAYADTGWGNTVNDAIRRGAPGMADIVAMEVAPGVIQSQVQNYINANYPGATPEQIAQLTPILTAQFAPIVTPQVRNSLYNQFSNINTRTKGWNIFVRQLYFQAKPVKGLEFSYGSLGINKGVNTESTAYDDDGYVSGFRSRVMRPQDIWFDEVSVTLGYLGDVFLPNFFRRTERFTEKMNYQQYLARKKFLGGKIDVSADYTNQDGTDTVREAVLFNVKDSKVLDTVRFEAYQRVGDNVVDGKVYAAGSGFAVQAEKTLFNKLTLSGGYTDIDRLYTVYGAYDTPTLDWFGFAINGDQTGLGKRAIVKANYKLTSDVAVSMLYAKSLVNNVEDMRYFWNKSHFNVAVTYDVLKAVKKLGLFR